MTTATLDAQRGISFRLRVARVIGALVAVNAVLLALQVITRVLARWTSVTADAGMHEAVLRLDLNEEGSAGTLWSVLLLSAVALTAFVIAGKLELRDAPRRGWWVALGCIAAALALDEGVGFHELLTAPMQRLLGDAAHGPLYFAWVVPALVAVVIAVIVFTPFARSLPSRVTRTAAIGVLVYVAGALGVQMLYAASAGVLSPTGQAGALALDLMIGLEEFLEMTGATIVLASLLLRLSDVAVGESGLDMRPDPHAVRRATIIALVVTGCLLVLHVLASVSSRSALGLPTLVREVIARFDMDAEGTVPAVVTYLLLAVCSATAFIIGRAGRRSEVRGHRWWYGVAAVLGYLSIDEALSLHELAFAPVQQLLGVTSGPLRFAWVVPGVLAVAAVAVLFLRFFVRLPADTRRAAGLAGVLYLIGALGMEMIAGAVVDVLTEPGSDSSLALDLLAGLEETLELVGVILVLRMLLVHLARHVAPGLPLRLHVL